MVTAAILVTALSGGLAGAFVTLSVQGLCRYWKRPVLEIIFRDQEPGCSVPTPAWLVDERGRPQQNEQGNTRTIQQHYLRLKIANPGKTFAKSTSVCITQISFRAHGAGQRVFAEEVFDLKLALTGDTSNFNLASGGHRFVDLAHTTQAPGEPVALSFDFVKGAVRLALLGFGIGQYEMNVFVAAENGYSISRELAWSWDGTLNGLRIIEQA